MEEGCTGEEALSGSDLLARFENILETDSTIDEIGFVHPSQFAPVITSGRGRVNSGFPRMSFSPWHHQFAVMAHSKAVLLLSSDFAAAWNSRRWAIKMLAVISPKLQEIVAKESDLVEQIAERSRMNYRAWNHRCWLVSYMTREQVLIELRRSKSWAALHVADNSCFYHVNISMVRYLADDLSGKIGLFLDHDLSLISSCLTIPDTEFEDFQAQALYSVTYILWLMKHDIKPSKFQFHEKVRASSLKTILDEGLPERSSLWNSIPGFQEMVGNTDHVDEESESVEDLCLKCSKHDSGGAVSR